MAQRKRGLPLDGTVVFEIGQNVAAPFAAQILADLGAKVIKVEKPTGDDARHWGPPDWEGASAMFQTLNRNKLAQVCNFREPAQLARLRRQILDEADVIIQNFRPGVLEGLGLGPEALRAEKPGLIYCDMGAFGSAGPLSSLPGYDPLMQAYGGMMSVTGEPGGAPVRTGYSVVDCGTGMWAAIAILSALLQRRQDSDGSHVEVSLFETALNWMQVASAQQMASGELPGRHGSGAATIVPYRAYEASDGYIVIAAGNDNLFARLCHALEHPEWAADARFATNPLRVRNRAAIDTLIGAAVRAHSRRHWVSLLRSANIPCAPVQDTAEAFSCEQAQALGVMQQVPNSNMQFVSLPLRLDGERPPVRMAPPALPVPDKIRA